MKCAIGLLTILFASAGVVHAADGEAIPLKPGVYLLLDDYLIANSKGIERKVTPPKRFLDEPIVSSKPGYRNYQPFVMVHPNPDAPAKSRFRMWYNADIEDGSKVGVFQGVSAYLESADGIHWPAPYRRLDSLTADGKSRFGSNVVDDGPNCAIPAERFKMVFYDRGKQAGPRIAFSPDGLNWTLHDNGRPLIEEKRGGDIWEAFWDPLRKRYFLFGKANDPITWTNADGKTITATVRRYHIRFSQDFKNWSEPKLIFTPDDKDPGITQWYGPAGFQVRGDLIVGFMRVLRDDLSPEGAPQEAIDANSRGLGGLGKAGTGGGTSSGSGTGYTVLVWSRDGETWHRDRHTDKFFEPDPKPGTWDHAMAWIGSSAIVGDEVFLYYAGYRWGHKYHYSADRQLGLVKTKRDRFASRQAGDTPGSLTTRPFSVAANSLTLNADAAGGEVRVQITDAAGKPIPGFRFEDCRPITADSLASAVAWGKPLSNLRGQTVRLEFSLRNAKLFVFDAQ